MVKSSEDKMLEELFALERQSPPVVPEAVMARVLSDAEAQLAPVRLPMRAARWRDWVPSLGGLPGLSGLAMATCVGFWLGAVPPQSLPDLAGQLLGVAPEVLDLADEIELDGFGWDIGEG